MSDVCKHGGVRGGGGERGRYGVGKGQEKKKGQAERWERDMERKE